MSLVWPLYWRIISFCVSAIPVFAELRVRPKCRLCYGGEFVNFFFSRAWEVSDFRRGVFVFDRNLDLLHLQLIRVFQTAQSWSDLGPAHWTRKASDPSTRVCAREISKFGRRWWIYQIIHIHFHYTEWIRLCIQTYGGKLTGPLREEATGVPFSSSHPLECSVTSSNWRLNLGSVIDHSLPSITTHFLVITHLICC